MIMPMSNEGYRRTSNFFLAPAASKEDAPPPNPLLSIIHASIISAEGCTDPSVIWPRTFSYSTRAVSRSPSSTLKSMYAFQSSSGMNNGDCETARLKMARVHAKSCSWASVLANILVERSCTIEFTKLH